MTHTLQIILKVRLDFKLSLFTSFIFKCVKIHLFIWFMYRAKSQKIFISKIRTKKVSFILKS
ncbi:hypothetical protein BpHYR1_011115 [Brachionus plicatilis]|uniref:Uncharacterized protein n=1 Tax=Brachionus plicatilis TaxID=10195 RepID=A0A3M7QBL7_BRAPC|nr:hypothetical protein BpHYR1_011115 [Brachionus plicatilis]